MFAGSVYADNEIYIDQSGDNVNIDLEQLGSSNMIGGLQSVNGSMTAAILTGGTWTLDINQIGSSNKFLTDGILGSNFTGFFEFDGDSNDLDFNIDSEYYTAYIDILGDSNTMTLDKTGYGASSSDAGYFYLDLNGSSNTINIEQTSTLALDWLKIESDASNSNICVVQSDGGTSTSC